MKDEKCIYGSTIRENCVICKRQYGIDYPPCKMVGGTYPGTDAREEYLSKEVKEK